MVALLCGESRREAATAWMQEVEQRRSSCRELPRLGSQAGAWEPAENVGQRKAVAQPTAI